MARRVPTDQNAAPPPPAAGEGGGRRPRARRETAELPAMTRARTSNFWGNRPPRAMSESVTMIADPAPKPATEGRTRAPTVNTRTRRPSTASDDFLEEVATNVVTDE